MNDFSFKELIVWQKGMDFASGCMNVSKGVGGHYRLMEQLEAAAASVPQNIAEGDGRLSLKETIHYLYIARGSLFESVTLLNLLHRQQMIESSTLTELESLGIEIVKMLNSLIAAKRKFD